MDLNEARDDRVAAASMYKTTASLLALFLSRETWLMVLKRTHNSACM